jgi:ligand-binding sensor domain-containing protein
MRPMSRQAFSILPILALTLCPIPELSAQYHFDSWTTENGLPENSVRAIRQTRDGYLWMTTTSSMLRFDGVRFREFNRLNTPGLAADGFSYYALMEDRQGCLWAGTWAAGAVRYCHGLFTTLTTKDGLPGNRVVRIDEDEQGAVWFFTDPGLAEWQNGRIIRIAPEPGSPFNDILLAPSDKVGVDGYLFGLWRIEKNRWQRFARGHWSEFPLPPGTRDGSDLHIASIIEDLKGRLWYRFRHDFATYYCLSDGRLTTFAGTPVNSIVSYQDANGNLWESGHDGHTNLWQHGKVTPLAGFSTPFLFRALEDREGSLWLGTTKAGLFRAAPMAITTLRNSDNPELNVIEPVLEARDGSIWYGSHGLFHLSDGKLRAFYHPGQAVRATDAGAAQGWLNIVSALYQDSDGSIWAGTWDGLAHLSGDVLVSDGPAAAIRGRVNAIHRDRNGDLWVGGERGLYRIQGMTLTHFTHDNGLGGDAVQVIREGRRGALWVGTAEGLSVRANDAFSPVAPPQTAGSLNITALYEDGAEVLWIGTYAEGLYRLEGGKLTHFTASDGLTTDSILQILEDGKGYLWLSSPTGIHRLKKADLNSFAAGQKRFLTSTVFNKADGMKSMECSSVGQPNGIRAKCGKNIAFSSNRSGQMDLYIKPADGWGVEKLLLKTDEPKEVDCWTRDGRFLLFTRTAPRTGGDIWAFPFPGEAKPVSLSQTQSTEARARVSPDGRWLAVRSGFLGTAEIYIRPFTPGAAAGSGVKWLVSKDGGGRPIWRPDGKGLFYLSRSLQVMGVDIDTSNGFRAGTPRRMFTASPQALLRGWDLSPDGKRFLFAVAPNTGRTVPFTVVLNWEAGLKK